MKTLLIAALLASAVAVTAGCSDTTLAHFESIGDSAHISCYSGGKLVYDGHSTGKVATTSGSDGWEFMDAADHKLVRVSGQCVVRQD